LFPRSFAAPTRTGVNVCPQAWYLARCDIPVDAQLAAYELAHLGFYTASPMELQRHAKRLVEEFGVCNIAELSDYPDKASASVRVIVTNLRLRMTTKGEKMAWLTLADATGAIEAAVFHLHFTPTYSSWINQVERWFAALTDKQLRRASHGSTRALENAIRVYLAAHNAHPKPFVWVKSADDIIDSIARFALRTSETGH
jgi:DNA polymerase III alpha subunit